MPKTPVPAKVAELLAKPNPATITVVRPDGMPVSVATWYLWDNGRILVNMESGRKRLDYLRENPRVSLTVLDRDDWYNHVSLQGRVTEFVDDPDLVDIDRLATHYIGGPSRFRDDKRISAWIEPEYWHGWVDGSPMPVD